MEHDEKPIVTPDTQAQRNLEHAEYIAYLHDQDRRTNETYVFRCVGNPRCECPGCTWKRRDAALMKAINTLWPGRVHSLTKTS